MSNAKQKTEQMQWADFLRAGAMAKRIGVSRATLYNYLRREELEFPRGIKLGGAVVFSVAAVDAWIQKRAALSDGAVA
jgi:excisionase family DNA binding protein